MKSPFRFIIISLCLLLLSSCDNFLEGADVKAQIEDAIAYNNATSYKIKIDYPESSGVIRSPAGGVVSKKVTDSFNIRFDPSSDYEFICWKIIDSVSKKEFKMTKRSIVIHNWGFWVNVELNKKTEMIIEKKEKI